jgi:glutathione S-transferase
MTLYLKAGPDGTSVGDCPFAHSVRMVLEEKELEYQLRPCGSNDDKPDWLKDHYEGKLPALRHRSECYVESDVIAQYVDYFFQSDSLVAKKKIMTEANEVVDGFFPAFAKYTKHTPDGDVVDEELKAGLVTKLHELEAHLGKEDSGRTGPWFVGDGEQVTLTDCSLAPKLYHMKICLEEFKGNPIDLSSDFPRLSSYCESLFSLPSFEKTVYPKEVVTWGWGNARST